MARTAVCIVNYNNGGTTIQCLNNILVQSYRDYNIVIVDNASTDNSITEIESYCYSKSLSVSVKNGNDCLQTFPDDIPTIIIIKSEKNGGYAFGVNIGIRFVHGHVGYENILVLNNDVYLTAGFIEEITNRFNHYQKKYHTTSIALGACEISPSGKFRHKGFHYLNLLSGLVFSFPIFPSLKYIVGSAIFIDSKAPLMDESFFLYYEDIHYQKILKHNKYRIYNCPNANYIHELGGSTKKDPEMYKIIYTSLKHFYKLNYPYLLPVVLLFRFIMNIVLCRWKIAKYILMPK
ncbi:MAG: glycosyltransferase [Bacteroidales bacterium]|jgi:hypothetical protein|nr:glycosyltransferase [Bacteroidales bacterium]MDD4215564.1 glycosyltransferase [Bacteroidales bacterium]